MSDCHHLVMVQPEPESDDEYPYEDIMMGKLPKRKSRTEPDNSCFHRATSFDNTFQLDMARWAEVIVRFVLLNME